MAAAVARSGQVADSKIAPNQSLYIQNLPEKLQKYDLQRNLYMLFSTYGPVINITALKTSKMRGQAHVLFKDVQSATQAMRNCQGYDFFGREMRIQYSKSRSNTIAKMTGTFHDEQATKAAPTNSATASSIPAPPGTLPAPPTGLPPPPGLPSKPNAQPAKPPALEAAKAGAEDVASPASTAGQKRQREESDDEDDGGDAPMEEDSDGGEMEMSDDSD